jgi:flagellar biosynthetic protein FlhB
MSVVTIALIAGFLFNGFAEMMTYFLGRAGNVEVLTDATVTTAFYRYFLRLALPVAVVAFVGAVIGNILQVGFLFTTKTIKPDFSKIVPKFGKFFKRSLFSMEAVFNLAKTLLKVVIIGFIAFLNIRARMDDLLTLIQYPFLHGFSIVTGIAFAILFESAVFLLGISVVDYFFQRRQHRESLKMSRQEIKEERKTYEGDPLVKNRLKQRMQELLSRNMVQRVEEADVVVTNPTHYAVAMEYQREIMEAPTVTAKGQDHLAKRIRETAEENDVPVIENKPLARALYAEVEIGDTIPEKYYEAVVTVLKQVYQMKGQSGRAV